MANVFIEDSTMSAIGDAIRAKTGGTDLILPANMATEIGNITTGGGDEGWGLAIGGGAEKLAGNIALFSSSGTYKWTENMPSEATDVYGYIEITATATDETGAAIAENFETRKIAVNPADITYSSLSYGMKRATFCSEFFSYTGAEHLKGTVNKFFSYKLPNMKVEDNILYANADCTCGIFGTSSRKTPLYLEGVDYRGSSITAIADYSFSGFTELKKVWLPEGLTEMGYDPFNNCTNLEEVHFTTATPPTVSSAMKPFADVPTTCKFYVPAGSLSAYTSASYYPSSSTYTYVEE